MKNNNQSGVHREQVPQPSDQRKERNAWGEWSKFFVFSSPTHNIFVLFCLPWPFFTRWALLQRLSLEQAAEKTVAGETTVSPDLNCSYILATAHLLTSKKKKRGFLVICTALCRNRLQKRAISSNLAFFSFIKPKLSPLQTTPDKSKTALDVFFSSATLPAQKLFEK